MAKKRIYIDPTKKGAVTASNGTALYPGMIVLVRNSTEGPFAVKLFSKYDDSNGSNYARNRPYKVNNKTETEQNFSFRFCYPAPAGTVLQ